MHGFGTLTWPDGRKYEGQFTLDKKEGRGVFSWPNGKQYDGQWANGNQHGIGYVTVNGSETPQKGEWRAGTRVRWLSDSTQASSTN
jgi:hypothetical protein